MIRTIVLFFTLVLVPLRLRAATDSLVCLVVKNNPTKFSLTSIQTSMPNASGTVHKKSAARAFGLSLLVPGAGQFYAQKGNESLIKGSLMTSLDLTSWIIYFHNRALGDKFVRKFENYANRNWNIDRYLAFLEDQCGYDSGYLGRMIPGSQAYQNPGIDREKLRVAENLFASKTGVAVHHLFETGKQQYYEMIYKYPEQFALGWSDAGPGIDSLYPRYVPSPTGYNRKTLTSAMSAYRNMRNKSNNYYDVAQKMTGLMLVNRFLSGLDAVWTTKRKNAEASQSMGLRIYPLMYNQKIVYLPSLIYQF